METGKTLAVLKAETDALGLEVIGSGKNGRILKKDYVKPLMTYNLIKRYGSMEDVPQNTKFRLSFASPGLVYNYFDLKPKEQEDVWDSKDIWLVEKINGIRGTLIFSKKEKWSLFSRDIDDSTYLWTDYAPKVLDVNITDLDFTGVFDVEIQLGNQDVKERLKELNFEVVSDFQVISALFMLDEPIFNEIVNDFPGLFKFKLIDIYYWDKDVRNKPYRDREKGFNAAIEKLSKVGLTIERPQYCKDPLHKKAFHEGLMKEGAEGTVATFADSPCVLTGQRKRDCMVKIKRSVFPLLLEPDALSDTVDGFISKVVKVDEETGLVHTIEVSAYDDKGKVRRIAVCEGIPLSIRQAGTLQEGAVVELSGTKWTDGLIEFAEVERVRFDKDSGSCIL
jgi:ATP-dependent DNA ligase